MSTDGFDTVTHLLGNYSEKANRELHAIKDGKETQCRKKRYTRIFTKVVNSGTGFLPTCCPLISKCVVGKQIHYDMLTK